MYFMDTFFKGSLKIIRIILTVIITFFSTHHLLAQFDTDYWMPPVWESRSGGDTDSMQLVITTAYNIANVTVERSDGVMIHTGTVSSGNPLKVFLSTILGMTYEANTVENTKGLLIHADYPVQVVYRNISHNNQCLAPLKGKFGLGTEFYTGTQTRVKEQSYGDDDLHFISVMATEDNTNITITAPAGKVFSTNTNSVTIQLDQYETYLVKSRFRENLSNNIAGSHVVSDKPIAVMSGGQHLKFGGTGGNNADAGIDQLVPVTSDIFEVIGTEYIIVRGGTREVGGISSDYAIIVATQDNTDIFIDGSITPVATINAGEYYEYTLPGTHNALGTPHYIQTSEKAFVYHISGLREHEMGMSIVPTIYCAGSKYLEFTRFEDNENYINIIAPEAAFATPGSLTINDQEFSAYDATPETVPGDIGWKTITFAYDTSQTTTPSIRVRSDYYFHLGILVGGNPAGAYGYLSGFSTKIDVLDPEALLPTNRYLAATVAPGGVVEHCLILESCNDEYNITNVFPGTNTGSISRVGNPGQPKDTCITYIAKPGYLGYDTVRVDVINAQGNPGSVELIFFIGKQPTVNNDEITVKEDSTVTGNVLTNDTNLEDGEIPEVISDPEHGSLTFNPDGSFSYTPTPNYSGPDKFIYQICDNLIPTDCNTGTVTIEVANVQDKPTVDDVILSGIEGQNLSFQVIYFESRFSDIDSDTLKKVKIISLPENATLLLEGLPVALNQEIDAADLDKLVLQPEDGFVGEITFDWNGFDGNDYADDSASVVITLTSQQIPVVEAFDKSVDEDTPITFTAEDFENSYENEDGDPLQKVKIINLPAGGILYLDGVPVVEGQEINVADLDKLTFEPYYNYYGTTGFIWIGSDGTNYANTSASVNIEVAPVDDGPPLITLADTVFIIKSSNFTVDLSLYVIDQESHGLTFNLTPIVDVQHGTLTINVDGTFTYTPAAGYVGTDSFIYEVCDSDVPPDCVQDTIQFNVDNSGTEPNPGELPITIYTGFSPDGDGINDIWEIDNIQSYPSNTVQIYNRWGNMIFEVEGYNNQDKAFGSQANTSFIFGEKEVPDGTYFYVINLGNGQKPYTGYIIINR